MKASAPKPTLCWPPLVEAHLLFGVRRLKSPVNRPHLPLMQKAEGSAPAPNVSPSPGVCELYKGIVSANGEDLDAYIKVLETKALVNELLAGSVGRALGLPIPDFFIVRADPKLFKKSALLSDTTLPVVSVFATRAVSASSLERRAAGNERETWQKLAAMDGVQQAVVFDEWMANGDRHAHNLLLSPDEFWLIDHEQCFTGSEWLPSHLIASGVFSNLLATSLLKVMNGKEKRQLLSTAHQMKPGCHKVGGWAASSDLLKQSKQKHHLSPKELKALCLFLDQRVAHIETLIADRVGFSAPPALSLVP